MNGFLSILVYIPKEWFTNYVNLLLVRFNAQNSP